MRASCNVSLTKAALQAHALEQRCRLLLELPPALVLPQPRLKLQAATLKHWQRNAEPLAAAGHSVHAPEAQALQQ